MAAVVYVLSLQYLLFRHCSPISFAELARSLVFAGGIKFGSSQSWSKTFRFGYGSEVRMRWKSWFPSQISSRFLKSCNCQQILAVTWRQKVKNSSLWAESWQSKVCLFSSIAGGFNDSFTPSLYNFLCNPSFAESASRVWNPKPKKKGHSVFLCVVQDELGLHFCCLLRFCWHQILCSLIITSLNAILLDENRMMKKFSNTYQVIHFASIFYLRHDVQ